MIICQKISFNLPRCLTCLVIILSIVGIGCNNDDSFISHDTPTPVTADSSVSAKPNNDRDRISSTSSCKNEKELIKEILTEMKFRVNEVRKVFKKLRSDDIAWGQYIRNWNIEAKNFREEYKARYFGCVHSFYIGETWIDLLQIGISYAFDNTSAVRTFERKLDSDINSTLKELKSIKRN